MRSTTVWYVVGGFVLASVVVLYIPNGCQSRARKGLRLVRKIHEIEDGLRRGDKASVRALVAEMDRSPRGDNWYVLARRYVVLPPRHMCPALLHRWLSENQHAFEYNAGLRKFCIPNSPGSDRFAYVPLQTIDRSGIAVYEECRTLLEAEDHIRAMCAVLSQHGEEYELRDGFLFISQRLSQDAQLLASYTRQAEQMRATLEHEPR